MDNKTKIIAIHGAGFSGSFFDELSKNISLKALNLPFRSSIEERAAWVKEELDKEDAATVTLLGHSMGALIALACHTQVAVKDIIIMGAARAMPVNTTLLEMARYKSEDAAAQIIKWGMFNPTDETKATLSKKINPATLYNDLKACNDYIFEEEISKSLLVISGAEDKMVKPSASRQLQRAQHVTVENCGHMIPIEKPAETALIIKQFLSGF